MKTDGKGLSTSSGMNEGPMDLCARTVHDDCPRRAHFDAGRFVERFGDDSHRFGYCLFMTGCKGPRTKAVFAPQHFAEVLGSWPVQDGPPGAAGAENSPGPEIAPPNR